MALEIAPQTDEIMEVAETVPRSLSYQACDVVIHSSLGLVRTNPDRFHEAVITQESVAA